MILTAILALTAAVPPQQYVTICSETFNYPSGPLGAQSGGTGWSSAWWSGTNGDDGLVVVPGLDPVGGLMRTNVEHMGSYRLIDMTGLDPILDQGLLGKDGTEIWVHFNSVRTSDDEYGGLILNWQWVQESLLIGSPFDQYEWGLDQPWFAPPYYVANTSCDYMARLAVRIDFQPGDEYVEIWIDPPTDFPTTAPDLWTWVSDFRFNEIGLKSGWGPTTATAFDFDDILISTPAFRPTYSVANVVAGQVANLDIIQCTPGSQVVIGWSTTGGGPSSSIFGNVDMSPPIRRFPIQISDAQGEVHLQQLIPLVALGSTIWTQCAELTGPGSGILSNSLAFTVQ